MDKINTYIYIHICAIENWREVVYNIYSKLVDSGLINYCTQIRMSILGDELFNIQEFIKLFHHPKIIIHQYKKDPSLYERYTLERLHVDVLNEPNSHILYLHSKGVSKKNAKNRHYITDWINMMLYFLVENYQECLKLLSNKADAIGVNLIEAPIGMLRNTGSSGEYKWHFSGNFWWANSKYIKTLPAQVGKHYYDPEMWIGKGTGKLYCIYKTTTIHYFNAYPRTIYIQDSITKHIDSGYTVILTEGYSDISLKPENIRKINIRMQNQSEYASNREASKTVKIGIRGVPARQTRKIGITVRK